MGIAIVAAIVVGTGLVLFMQRDVAIEGYRTAQNNLAYMMSRQTDYMLSAVNEALQTVQDNVVASARSGEPDKLQSQATYNVIGEQVDRVYGFDALILVAADGKVANSSWGWPAAASDVSGRDYFSHFKRSDDHALFIGMPVRNAATGLWSVPMARRIDSAHGQFAGVAVVEFSLSDLAAFYHLAMPLGRVVYVARRDGVVLLRYPVRDSDIGRRIPPSSLWYETVARGGGNYDGAAYFEPDLVIAHVTPLTKLPIVIQTSVNQADALRQWRQDAVWDVLGGLVAALSAIGLLKLFARQFDRIESSKRRLFAINAELDLAHRQLEATLANLAHGVCFFGEDKKLLVYNQRFCQLIGVPEELVHAGMPAVELAELRVTRGTFLDQTVEEFVASLDARMQAGVAFDEIVTLVDGRTISKHFEPLAGHGWVMTHEDISERRAAEEKITYLAHHDMLTGLANRALLQDRLAQALNAPAPSTNFAVLCLDLDRFKAVNDTYGHRIGDNLLRAVADRLRAEMRAGDTIARLGGDEFVILQLEVSDISRTDALAGRIIEAIGAPFEIEGHRLSIGVSIGIAFAPGDRISSELLLQHADMALYRSKEGGRGTWRMFEPETDLSTQPQGGLEDELRIALAQGELQLHYMPIMRGKSRSLAGFEALLRWAHPERGMLAAEAFIGLAEQIGVISEISAWAVKQACTEAKTWPGHLRVEVNLSVRQFIDETLVPIVSEALLSSGLEPGRLELEITESVPLLTDPSALAVLGRLRKLGVRVALGDFGTGFSSLAYLRSFPFDAVKIDRSLVSALETHAEYRAIIQGLIGVGSHLGMESIAEGVETESQFNFLVAAGCHEIQGFWVGRPAPAAALAAMMESLAHAAAAAASKRAFMPDAPERRHPNVPKTGLATRDATAKDTSAKDSVGDAASI